MDYNKITRFLFLSAIAICPLIFFTDLTRNPYAIQLVVFQVAMAAVLGIFVLKINKEKRLILPKTVLDKPLTLFFLFCFLTFLNSYFLLFPQWKLAVLSFSGRKLLFLLLNAILLFYITVDLFGDEKGRKRLMWVLFITAGIASSYGILQYLGIELIWTKRLSPYGVRSVSTFGNPNFMSSYLLLVIPVITVMLFYEKSLKKKLIYGLVGSVNVIGLLVTETRSSWLGLSVAITLILVVMAIFHKKIILANKKWMVLLIILFLVIGMIPFKETGTLKKSSIFNRLVNRIVSIKNVGQAAYVQRFLMWSASLSIFKDHPLVGIGWGNYEIVYPYHQSKFLKINKYSNLRTHSNNAHNEVLEIITQVGIVGFGLYVWLFYVFFRRLVDIYRNTGNEYNRVILLGLGASIVGMFVDNMLNVSLHFPMPAIPFWINMGLVIAIGREGKTISYRVNLKKKSLFLLSSVISIFIIGIFLFNIRYFSGEIHYFKGFKSARRNDLDNAVKECLLSYEAYPLNVDNNYELGNAYARLKNKEKALWAYEKAIRANPGYDEIYFNLGVVYAQKNDFDKAFEMLNESIKINPLFKDSWLNLGNVYIQKKMWEKAAESFYECLKLEPEEKTAKQNLSYVLTNMFNKGQVYVDEKDWINAEKLYGAIVKIVPNDVKAHLYLGNIYFSNKKHEQSIIEYRKVLELSGKKDVNIMNNLGMAYMEAGKNVLAVNQFLEVLGLFPGNALATDRLKELKDK